MGFGERCAAIPADGAPEDAGWGAKVERTLAGVCVVALAQKALILGSLPDQAAGDGNLLGAHTNLWRTRDVRW